MIRGKIHEQQNWRWQRKKLKLELFQSLNLVGLMANSETSKTEEVDGGSWEITLISSQSSWLSVMGWRDQWKVDASVAEWGK